MCRLNIPSHYSQSLPLFHHLMVSGIICLHHLFRCLSSSFSLPHHPAIYLQDWMHCMLYVLANLVAHQPTLSCFSTLLFNRGAITSSSHVLITLFLTYLHIQFVSFHNNSTLLVCIQVWHLQTCQGYTLYHHYPWCWWKHLLQYWTTVRCWLLTEYHAIRHNLLNSGLEPIFNPPNYPSIYPILLYSAVQYKVKTFTKIHFSFCFYTYSTLPDGIVISILLWKYLGLIWTPTCVTYCDICQRSPALKMHSMKTLDLSTSKFFNSCVVV